MSNEVANKQSSAVGALQNLGAAIAGVRQSLPETVTGDFLRFKKGDWSFGSEHIEPEAESKWLIDVNSMKNGFVCWTTDKKKNELLGRELASILTAPVNKAALPDHGYPWKPSVSFALMCTNGEDKGVRVSFETSSVGGVGAVDNLLASIGHQINEGNDYNPVVLLDTSSYFNKNQNEDVFVPVFVIAEWYGDIAKDAKDTAAAADADAPIEDAEPEEVEGEVVEDDAPEEKPKSGRRTRSHRAAKR